MSEVTAQRLTTHALSDNFQPPRWLPPVNNITYNILNVNAAQEHLRFDESHRVIAFIIPVLLNFVQVKFQATGNSPFQTHPLTTIVAVSSLLAYGMAYIAKLQISHQRYLTHSWIFQGIISISSLLSLASIASLLFPDAAQPVLYILCTLLMARALYNSVKKLCQWIYQQVVAKQVSGLNARGWQMRRTPPLLPL